MTTTGTPNVESLLLSCEWAQLLTPVAMERVIADCHDRLYGAREMVAHRGEPAASWIGVAHGLLKVSTVTATGRSMMFTAVPSGSWVGEGSVIKREPRRYDLLAIRETRVIHVPRTTFLWLLGTSVEFSRYIIDHLNERTGQFIAMLEVSRITDPAGRVAGAICNLFNPVLYPRASQLLNISQEEMAELAGLSRPTTSMAIAKLRKLHLVHAKYGSLLVLDLQRLQEFVRAVGSESD